MKRITSATVWEDGNGTRLSVTYSVIDENTRQIKEDNVRANYILTDSAEIATAQALTTLAQSILDEQD